jgi:hypothetical protein
LRAGGGQLALQGTHPAVEVLERLAQAGKPEKTQNRQQDKEEKYQRNEETEEFDHGRSVPPAKAGVKAIYSTAVATCRRPFQPKRGHR